MPGSLYNANDSGFCLTSADQVSCFGKANNVATLPATGTPTTESNLPATGFEGPMDTVTLSAGESYSFGVFTCTATVGGFDCVSEASGAAISVAGPVMEVTQPTR